jgi:hypothetical protein
MWFRDSTALLRDTEDDRLLPRERPIDSTTLQLFTKPLRSPALRRESPTLENIVNGRLRLFFDSLEVCPRRTSSQYKYYKLTLAKKLTSLERPMAHVNDSTNVAPDRLYMVVDERSNHQPRRHKGG